MPVKGDKVYLKAKPQFFQPAGNPITGFYRQGSVPNDSVVNDWIPDNYNDCTYLGEMQVIDSKRYYLVRLNFSYYSHRILGISTLKKSSEDLWFLEEEISFEYVDTAEDIAKKEKAALQKSLLEDASKSLTGSAEDASGSSNTGLYVAIAAVVAVLGAVIWWAFGKKRTTGTVPPAVQPSVIVLPKSKR